MDSRAWDVGMAWQAMQQPATEFIYIPDAAAAWAGRGAAREGRQALPLPHTPAQPRGCEGTLCMTVGQVPRPALPGRSWQRTLGPAAPHTWLAGGG